MYYKSVVVTRRGGLDAIEIVEKELREPGDGEARVRILASPVCQDDIAVRIGNRPFLAKPPFIPGYSILGVVDAVGTQDGMSFEGNQDIAVGDHVVALTNFGGHSEYIYLDVKELAHVPPHLEPAKAVTLILNYLVAYQVMHRVVQVKPLDKVCIIGASGGVGIAFMQLGKLADLKMYGLASFSKHPALMELGAIPIDYRSQDFVGFIRQVEPDGIDYVFNGMGEEYFERGLAVLSRGGALVHYGGPQSFSRFLLLIGKFILFNLLPNGKAIKGYGTHRLGTELFKEDWAKLFELLEQGQINPIVTRKYPILEAREAYKHLESGQVTGNIVLLAPELL